MSEDVGVAAALAAPIAGAAAPVGGPLLDLLLRALRKAHLTSELTRAGMPNAAAAVAAGDWASILAWVEANAGVLLQLVVALISLLSA